MPEDSAKKIFARNLNYFLDLNDKKQIDLAKYMGSSTGLVSSWCRGEKMPRVNKIKAICDWFHIEMTDLLTDKTKEQEDGHYLNEETKRIAAEIYNSPDLHALFDMCIEMPPERLSAISDFIKRLQAADFRESKK